MIDFTQFPMPYLNYYVQQYLFARSINMNSISSTYLCNITDHQLCVINLNGLPFSYDAECLLPINTFLQTSKLSFFGPIIKCGYDYNDNNRYQNGSTFNPCVMFLFFWFIYNYDIIYVVMIQCMLQLKQETAFIIENNEEFLPSSPSSLGGL